MHFEIYNKAITEPMKQAFIARDNIYFINEIKLLSSIVLNKEITPPLTSTYYDLDLSRLQICLAMYDSLNMRGQTSQLLGDYINF
jgi:hypothetical protein